MQAPGCALRTSMNGSGKRKSGFSRRFVPQLSPLLATGMSPVHASQVTTTQLVSPRRPLLEATLAAGGTSQRGSLAITGEDNNRSHSNCGWVDHAWWERVRALLECTIDHPVRETRANFENIVRVVVLPPRCAGGRVGLPVRNLRLFQGQVRASR